MHTDCELDRCEKCDKEQAVIEAARVCVARHPMGSPHLSARSWLALVESVRALDSEET